MKSMYRQPFPLILVCGLMFCMLTACGSTPFGFLRNDPKPTAAAGAVIFEDDFSKQPGNWGTWGASGGAISYEHGGLRMVLQKSYTDIWSVAGQNFQDAKVVVKITRLNGPLDNNLGVICRYQDRKNFYMFLVSSDGYYGIAKIKDDKHSLIGAEQLQYSSVLVENPETMLLEAKCSGSDLSLAVNGIQLVQVNDSDFSSGDVGLLTGSNGEAGVDALFTNFMVTQP